MVSAPFDRRFLGFLLIRLDCFTSHWPKTLFDKLDRLDQTWSRDKISRLCITNSHLLYIQTRNMYNSITMACSYYIHPPVITIGWVTNISNTISSQSGGLIKSPICLLNIVSGFAKIYSLDVCVRMCDAKEPLEARWASKTDFGNPLSWCTVQASLRRPNFAMRISYSKQANLQVILTSMNWISADRKP